MLSASQSVKDQIYAPSRRIAGKVTFGITDVTAYTDVEESWANDYTDFCAPWQTFNGFRDATYKLATYEDDWFSLDGSVSFPDPSWDKNGETGLIGSTLCGANSMWLTPYVGRLTKDGIPAPNEQFALQNLDTGTWYDFKTDAKGEFRFDTSMYTGKPPNGRYASSGVTVAGVWYNNPVQFTLTDGFVNGNGPFWIDARYYWPMSYPNTCPYMWLSFASPHSSAGITVTFDTLSGEYATEYIVNAYDPSQTLITSVKVTNNKDVVSQAIGQLYGYQYLEIIVTKWCKPYRRGRILEIDFGIVKVYTDDGGLIRFSVAEEIDLTSGQIPSAETTFEVDNSDRAFNILNPNGFYKYLQQRQVVNVSLGVEIGNTVVYQPAGTYYLADWTSNEGAMTATFTARTALDLMSSYDYEQTTPLNISLYNLASNIIRACGINNYQIDMSLTGIMTNALSKKIDCRTALQMVAIAGCCNIIVDRYGTIKLVKADTIGAVQDNITFDNVYTEPQIRLEKVVKSVEVKYWTDLNTSSSVYLADPNVGEGDALVVEGNTFVNDFNRVNAVATWVLNQKNNRRALFQIDFRGNPLLELTDIVSIENSYGTDQAAILTKQDITYEGYLHVTAEARGLVK